MAEQDFRLRQIGVVMLGVKDLGRAVAFYRDTLGLALKSEIPAEFAFFDAGGVTLCLSTLMVNPNSPVVGATEVVFSVDDVTRAYQALRSKGVQFIREPRNVTGSLWAANFTDPDGHRLSIFGPKGA